MKTCAVCPAEFVPARMGQVVCSIKCARRMPVIARKSAKIAAKATLARRKEAAKPRSKWMAEAQQAFNAWIRARDWARGCISCGATGGKMNAGHYLSTGARPELRFDPLNVHKQCERCNSYLHGNLVLYRAELIKRIGMAEVERLEGPHEPKKYTMDDLRAIRDLYRRKVKEAA